MIYRAAMLGAAGASFSPDDIAGLQLWLDASDASTITESSGAVSQWDDKSGNANHVTQGVAAEQPATGTRTINSLNVVDFDGTDDFLDGSFTAVSGASVATVIMALQYDTVAGVQYAMALGDASAPGSRLGPTQEIAVRCNSSLETYSTVISTNASVLTVRSPGPDVDALSTFLNGSELAVASATNATLSFANGVSIGSREGGIERANIAIGEVLVYDSALSVSDREAAEAYLAAKWGITLS